MERIKRSNRYQKGILLLMLVMSLVFAVIYPAVISRVGFAYRDTILVPSQENGATTYSGKIQGKSAVFTVSQDHVILFEYGDSVYGPYTIKEDASAIPEDAELADSMTGVEIRQGDQILFRGGVVQFADQSFFLYREDGSLDYLQVSYIASDGIERDENGNAIAPAAPSAYTILELLRGPELTHKGFWFAWFGAVLICIFNAFSILYADELFHLHLSFRMRDANYAEPSELEIIGRYVSWSVLLILALVVFIMGLQ